ncbi:MAG: ClC family H(+)/Cl(-) exchange transporter [Eubacteriales bacterium]|nr:ClC family H(+)/Cl(-) exchange transporter [Eubacteriales bacterium]
MSIKNDYHRVIHTHHRKLTIVYKSILVGLFVGIVTILYRLSLTIAEEYSFTIFSYVSGHRSFIFPLFIILGILGWSIGHLVRKYPVISGSGIPQVRGQLLGYFKNPWVSTLFAKFIGGTVTILAGLSVGREGPSIQLGATTAHGIGGFLAATRTERKILIASGASAGLAVAFNAPLAGVMFALEEIFKYFSPTILLATITSAVTADFISTMIFGLEPVFDFALQGTIPISHYWLIVVLGIIVGISGAFYNYALIKTVALSRTISSFNKNLKFIVPFLIAGILGLTFPIVLGGGSHIIEVLSLNNSIQWLLLVLGVKFLFSMISYGSGAPGGIFFPLLVIGSLIGGLFGNIAISSLGINPDLFFNFIVLAMAGFFTAIVRAPITGVILLTEMTGSFSQLLPLTVVSIIAYITADLLKSTPIYESLLDLQMSNNMVEHEENDVFRKTTFEAVVHHGSEIEGQCLKNFSFPLGSLVIAIRRHGKDITPNGMTSIQAEDYLVVLTSIKDEAAVRKIVEKMTGSS